MMYAEVIAVGPYTSQVADALDYRAEYYRETLEGAVITRRLFGIVEGSSLSREFAAMLGISDTWDFNQHRIDPRKADFEALAAFGKRYPEYQRDVEAFRILHGAGFQFHFRPEG